jgi:hypothetical protein
MTAGVDTSWQTVLLMASVHASVHASGAGRFDDSQD